MVNDVLVVGMMSAKSFFVPKALPAKVAAKPAVNFAAYESMRNISTHVTEIPIWQKNDDVRVCLVVHESKISLLFKKY